MPNKKIEYNQVINQILENKIEKSINKKIPIQSNGWQSYLAGKKKNVPNSTIFPYNNERVLGFVINIKFY